MLVYHVVLPEYWIEMDTERDYVAASLAVEGFIHCSYSGQLDDVLKRYYSNADEVLILTIDTDKLSSRLVEEPSTNNEIYPHIYGPVNREAIVEVEPRKL
ncbi:MAG: DUF952 domain-containing protein [Acidobacteriota bacterium]